MRMMNGLLLAVSVLAMTSGGVFAQNTDQSPQPPTQSPVMPPPAGSGPGASGPSSGAGNMGAVPGAPGRRPAARHFREAMAVQIRQAQQTLKEEGLYKGKVDGIFGPQTKAAVTEFQKQAGLKQTARLDRATMHALKEASGAPRGGGMPGGGGGGAPEGGSSPGGGGPQ